MDFLIPVRTLRRLPGRLTLAAPVLLRSAARADALPLAQLAETLAARCRLRSRIGFDAWGPATVRVRRSPSVRGREAYRLTVARDGVEVLAAADAGAYYGIQTLRDMIALHGNVLPCSRIDDRPDVARRGVYYDCARGKVPTVETLKALVERLAHWKINEFQIYIKNTFTWRAHPAIGRGFSPYTPDDMLEIQEHCRRHHVDFVPSLATLSHNELTLQLPRYRHLAELPGAHGWEGGTMLCPTDPNAFRLVKELYREYLPLFTSGEMNVCCDEPWELGQGRSRRAVRRRGAGNVYLGFLLKLHRLCGEHGKRMNVWGDIVLQHPELIPKLPRDVVCLNWDYAGACRRMARTREFKAAGVPVMVCPGTSGWQRHGTDMPNAVANVAGAARIGRRQGALGLLNTDWGDCGHRNPLGVSLHGFAHGAAHAWHGAAVDDAAFTARFARLAFGGGAVLADAIRTLGGTSATASTDSACLYHALVEPLRPPAMRFMRRFRRVSIVSIAPVYFPNMIDKADPEGLVEVIERLSAVRVEAPVGQPAFEAAALADLRLAAAMDVLAARRALMGQTLRAGGAPPTGEAAAWSEAMAELMTAFERLWRLRFRPSRLADNLTLMHLALEEARALRA
jgi:hypothetical protein